MSFVETVITSSSSSPKRLESLPILSLVTRRNSRKNATMPSSASSSSSSSASSTSQQQQQQQNANNSDQNSSKQPQSHQNLPLPIIHHPVACTYLGADDGKEFDDVVFDILKVDPDDIAVRNQPTRL